VNRSRSSWWDLRDTWPDHVRRFLICPWRGHVPAIKFSGTILCRRCNTGLGHT
jgi:hypothetical protein